MSDPEQDILGARAAPHPGDDPSGIAALDA